MSRSGAHRGSVEVQNVLLAAGALALIVYGSLYSFDFFENEDPGVPFRALFATWRTPSGWADMAANILFYLPFGFFVVKCCRLSTARRLLLVLAAGIALSMSMELSQYYVIDRIPSMADVYANAAGALSGALLGCLANRATENRFFHSFAGFKIPLFLLACWMLSRLFPYVPVIDLHKYGRALRAVAVVKRISVADVYRNAVEWMAAAAILERLPGILSSGLAVCVLAGGILFARILIDGILLSRAELAGLGIGLAMWMVGVKRLPTRALTVAIMTGAVYLVPAGFPSPSQGVKGTIEWMPLASLMEAQVNVGVPSFFEKVFLCGSLLWLLQCAGTPRWRSTVAAAFFVLGGEVICFYTGNEANTTDVVILLMVAAGMKLLDTPGSATRRI